MGGNKYIPTLKSHGLVLS